MKKIISVFLIVCIVFPAFAFANDQDPITGAWYFMLDYREGPQTAQTIGKSYMLYIIIFEETGDISAISGEVLETNGLSSTGMRVGRWENNKGKYTVDIVGIGSYPAEFSGDRLLVQVSSSVWYSMQRMNLAGWYTDIITRY